MNWQRTAIHLLVILAVNAEILDFDDKNADDLCYTCSCKADRTEVDCSRRGLTRIPDGLNHKVSA